MAILQPVEGVRGATEAVECPYRGPKGEALEFARKAAHLLRKEFGAEKVLLFGSLAHEEWFGPWSDIDLAAQGILPESFYSAVASVTGMSPSFRIDLIDMDECRPTLRKVIEEEGIEI